MELRSSSVLAPADNWMGAAGKRESAPKGKRVNEGDGKVTAVRKPSVHAAAHLQQQ